MNYTALYSTLYRVRGLTHTAAKVFTWLFDVQLLVLYGLATVAGAPLTNLAGPGLRFAAALTAFVFTPYVFDAVLARISTRYRRTWSLGTKKTASQPKTTSSHPEPATRHITGR